MSEALVIFSAVVPSLLLVWYFDSRDLYPEPRGVLWSVFGLGICVVLPVLPIALLFDGFVESLDSPVAQGLASAFLQAAIPEEFFKFVVVWFYAAHHREFDEPMDGIVYGVVASLGFATLENVLYAWDGGLQLALLRAVTAVPAHAFLGAIMGFWIGRARFSKDRGRSLALALAIPIALHGLYDFPLLAVMRARELSLDVDSALVALTALAPLIVAGQWIVAVQLTRKLRMRQLGGVEAPGRASSLALTIVGAALASFGGVLLAGLGLGGVFGLVDAADQGQLIAGGVLGGLTPVLIGGALFLWGIRRLNESESQGRSADSRRATVES